MHAPPDTSALALRSHAARLVRRVTHWLVAAEPVSGPAGSDSPPGRLARLLAAPAARCAALALLVTVLLTALGVTILNSYHTRAHYHFDSAGYRYTGILFQQSAKGARWTHAWHLLQQKDSLDTVIRLLIYPKSLSAFHGHLLVQVPFMALFFFLALWYVHRHTGSYLYGVAATSVVLLFGTIYHPVQGLMDFWKDNLAIWLLGGALLSWFLSENGTQRRWGALCGVLMSLLALQRVVVVVYGAAIFLPLLTTALVQRLREGDWRKILGDVLAFGLAPLFVATFMVVTQAKGVIHYYTVTGYDYSSPGVIAKYLWTHPFSAPPAFRYGLLAVLVIATAARAAGPGRVRGVVAGLWPLFAFPALVIATKAMYHSFSAVLLVLAVVAVCRLVPRHLSAPALQRVAAALLVVTAVAGTVQARHYAAVTEQYAQSAAPYRATYRELGEVLAAKPPASGIGFFFDECTALVELQLYYDREIRPSSNAVRYFSSVHPTYYKASFGDKLPEEISASIIADMERDIGAIAVVPVQITTFACRVAPDPTGKVPVPVQVNERIMRHVQTSPRWKATRYIASEVYGPLLVFQASAVPLSHAEKWSGLNYHSPITGLNLTAPVAPQVRQLSYSTDPRSPAEWYNGAAYQWVLSGEHGATFSVLVDRPTEVILRAGITPGPSRSGPNRTVVMRHAGTEQRFEFSGEGELRVPIRLTTGLNEVKILSPEQADLPPPPGDNRPLMFRLKSPHLLPNGPETAK